MAGRLARSWRAVMAVLVAVAAVGWLATVVTAEVRRAPDTDCIAVHPSVTDAIAARPATDRIEPVHAVAVHDPWNRSTASVPPFDDYYAIAMEFRRTDGSMVRGVWGLGAGPSPSDDQPLTIGGDGPGSALVSVDDPARQTTVWPDTELHFPQDANAVAAARRCLDLR